MTVTIDQMLDQLLNTVILTDAATLARHAGCTEAAAEAHLRRRSREGKVTPFIHTSGKITWMRPMEKGEKREKRN